MRTEAMKETERAGAVHVRDALHESLTGKRWPANFRAFCNVAAACHLPHRHCSDFEGMYSARSEGGDIVVRYWPGTGESYLAVRIDGRMRTYRAKYATRALLTARAIITGEQDRSALDLPEVPL